MFLDPDFVWLPPDDVAGEAYFLELVLESVRQLYAHWAYRRGKACLSLAGRGSRSSRAGKSTQTVHGGCFWKIQGSHQEVGSEWACSPPFSIYKDTFKHRIIIEALPENSFLVDPLKQSCPIRVSRPNFLFKTRICYLSAGHTCTTAIIGSGCRSSFTTILCSLQSPMMAVKFCQWYESYLLVGPTRSTLASLFTKTWSEEPALMSATAFITLQASKCGACCTENTSMVSSPSGPIGSCSQLRLIDSWKPLEETDYPRRRVKM